MPARIVVVHDDAEFLGELTSALRLAGFDVAAFADPMHALDAIDKGQRTELLITRMQFASGTPNGITLARMARFKRTGIRILFTALPEFAEHAEGLGAFLPMPVNMQDVVETVERMLLKPDNQSRD